MSEFYRVLLHQTKRLPDCVEDCYVVVMDADGPKAWIEHHHTCPHYPGSFTSIDDTFARQCRDLRMKSERTKAVDNGKKGHEIGCA